MTTDDDGPEHYREAERLLSISVERSAVERAQAHALLALTAATANLETGNPDNLNRNALDAAPGVNWDDDRTAWKDVLK